MFSHFHSQQVSCRKSSFYYYFRTTNHYAQRTSSIIMKPWNSACVSYFWALCLWRTSVGFSNCHLPRRVLCESFLTSRTSSLLPPPRVSHLRLSAQSFNETAATTPSHNHHDSALFNAIASLDIGRISWDILALLVAFELEGLVDALNAPEFLANGGWLQAPPPMADSTLPTLVQRLSVNGVLWILMACVTGAVNLQQQHDSKRIDGSTDSPRKMKNDRTRQSIMSFVGFLVLRLLLGFTTTGNWNGPFFEIYFAALALGTVRIVQQRLYG